MPADAARREEVHEPLQGFGLTPSEAKVLVALLELGSASASELARATGITRTNLYPTLEALKDRDLVRKTPALTSIWTPVAHSEILLVLRQREERKFAAAQAALVSLEQSLERLPAAEDKAKAVFRIVESTTAGCRYEEALGAVNREILVFNRGPYTGALDADPAVGAAVARGADARALYQAHELYDPPSDELLRMALEYEHLGVSQRVVDSLPISMAVLDRSLALVSVPAEAPDRIAYVANVIVESPSFAETMAHAFEHLWGCGEAIRFTSISAVQVDH